MLFIFLFNWFHKISNFNVQQKRKKKECSVLESCALQSPICWATTANLKLICPNVVKYLIWFEWKKMLWLTRASCEPCRPFWKRWRIQKQFWDLRRQFFGCSSISLLSLRCTWGSTCRRSGQLGSNWFLQLTWQRSQRWRGQSRKWGLWGRSRWANWSSWAWEPQRLRMLWPIALRSVPPKGQPFCVSRGRRKIEKWVRLSC